MEMVEQEPAGGWWKSETNGWELGSERLFHIAALCFLYENGGTIFSTYSDTQMIHLSESQRRDSQVIVTRKLYISLKARV